MRTLETRKGRTVETPHTDAEALELLRQRNGGGFGADLVGKADRYGNLSADQWVWVHILVIEADKPKPEPIRFERILATLTRARDNGLKYPKVRLVWGAEERPLVLSLAGGRARFPDAVNVTDGRPYGENAWYGRIHADGDYVPGHETPEEIVKVLEDFDADPSYIGALHGRVMGRCCFCGRELTTRESVGAGYGPICSQHYGLPWGDTESYEEKKAAIIETVMSEEGAA